MHALAAFESTGCCILGCSMDGCTGRASLRVMSIHSNCPGAQGVIRKWAGGEELPGQRTGSGRSSPGSSESGGRSATPGADQPSGARGRAPVTAGRWEP